MNDAAEKLNILPDLLEKALRAQAPRGALQKVISYLLEIGLERDQLLPALDAFREKLAAEGRADEEDLILELVDGFTGWCRLD